MPVADEQPERTSLRLGHFAVPAVTADARHDYGAIIDLAVHAEREGFASFWVAEGRAATNGLPSALAFLAALTQRTDTIRLGTAVIAPAFVHPLTLAETAAVVDALGGGRLELGLGKSNHGGWSAPAFHAFALDETDRDDLYADALARVRAALGGSSDGQAVTTHPPSAHLRARIWQATSRGATAAAAGAAGDGLLLHRRAAEGKTGDVQSGLIDAYLGALAGTRPARIAVSRVVLPARDREEAIEVYRRYVVARPEYYRRLDPAADLEEHLIASNIAYGSPADIVRTLRADRAVQRSTEVLFSVPLPFDAPEYRVGLTTIARAINPRLAKPRAQVAETRTGAVASVAEAGASARP